MPLPPLPGFIAHISAHYAFPVRPGSLAEADPTGQEAVYARVTAVPTLPLHYVFAADAADPLAGGFVTSLVERRA